MPRNGYPFLLLLICLSCALPTHAQLNFGVGYSLGYLHPSEDRTITKTYNNDRPWLDDGLEPINVIQGFNLNLRYRFDFVAFEIGWRNKFRNKNANGTNPADNSSFSRELSYKYLSYYLGIENFISDFSYGASIEVENLGIRTEVSGLDGTLDLINEYGFGTNLFVAYNLDAGNSLTFSIRPYVHIPLQTYNIAPLAAELNGDTVSELSENYLNFGIMLVFYNGKK